MNAALFSSHRADWETPPELFAELDREFWFELDVCATHENHKCARWFDVVANGLVQDWAPARCWMNPPYGRAIGKWIAKASLEAQCGALVVALIPARTDTAWWHDCIWDAPHHVPRPWVREIRFLRGRIKFVGGPSAAPFPSAVVVMWDPIAHVAAEWLSRNGSAVGRAESVPGDSETKNTDPPFVT